MRAETSSDHKHQNTVKYVIGITPAAVISFLSDGWRGCASDMLMTLDFGFLGKREHGGEILADRGFLVGKELADLGETFRILRGSLIFWVPVLILYAKCQESAAILQLKAFQIHCVTHQPSQ